MLTVVYKCFVLLIAISTRAVSLSEDTKGIETTDVPKPLIDSNIYYISVVDDQEARSSRKNVSASNVTASKLKNKKRKNSSFNEAIRIASLQGFNAMIDLYERKEPEILRKGEFLDMNHPATKLSLFSAPMTNDSDLEVKGAYASLYTAKKLQERPLTQ
ncbi:CLUMA_CG017011, isoform A [Clunio marinus]|uniref:CLUMA_CG017011, isoform A n=1 Tax=Clunio marinus TaxID=568069 RepID=A0A1J1IUM8_9DIPT|nr:CLUMA_CG017011, isoform A [Clunio marinus]